MVTFFMDGFQLPQGYSHFEEAVYFLPFSFQKFLVLIQFCYSTITLPLSSQKQSSSIFCQSSPFCKVSPQVLPQMAPPSFQSMTNHISMESVFRSLSIAHWPKEQVVAGDFLLKFKFLLKNLVKFYPLVPPTMDFFC